MVKSVYVWCFTSKRVYCLQEAHAKKEQRAGHVRIMPKSEAFAWIEAEKKRKEKDYQDSVENQGVSVSAIAATEEDLEDMKPVEKKKMTIEEEKEELLSLLVANGTVELKGSWYRYEGNNYRKSEILEVI